MITHLPARQIHLDFHTSEQIADVGARFSKKQFAQALRLGHVNHINLFAKCHHGWAYYPTKVGHRHPTLKPGLDLLGEQLEVCHKMGINAPIYYTVGFSVNDYRLHPQWAAVREDGTVSAMGQFDAKAGPETPLPYSTWPYMCINAPGYRKQMLDEVKEICELYQVDGFWFDILGFHDRCYCPQCRKDMVAAGVKESDAPAVVQWYTLRWADVMRDLNAAVHQHHPNASIFHNQLAHLRTPEIILKHQTHYELEDLPTTWGGYEKLPLRARYFGGRGRAVVAMSGKFHTSWGEFGGFKHPDAIKYEAAAMLAYGAACNFGDQLHPSGEMDLGTYRNIGKAFEYVKKIEAYALLAVPCANLGILICRSGDHDQGVSNMLMESQIDFEVAPEQGEPQTDWKRFDTIILPGGQFLDQAMAGRLREYVKAGGRVLAMYESLLDAGKTRFGLDAGVEYIGPGEYDMDYLVPGKKLGKGLQPPDSPFVTYSCAPRTRVTDGEVLAAVREPYFSRTYGHFCSHQNTPYQLKDAKQPGAVRKGRVVYLAHPLASMYAQHGARQHRELFINALRLIYRKQTLSTEMPSAARATLARQAEHRRYVAHLLYAPPLKRGRCLVIEDFPILRDVPVTLRVSEKIKKAWLPVSGKTLRLTRHANGGTSVIVPEVRCHEMVVFEY